MDIAAQLNGAIDHAMDRATRRMPGGYDMSQSVTDESKYPHIVELAVGTKALDVGLGRRIMGFHNSRRIKPRHGRIILREGKTYYRWCFPDLAAARAFIEQFGGSLGPSCHE